MPLYIRSNVAWTPNSLKDESFHLDDSDFVQDPDQQRDQLPQPYRLVDKILCGVIDNVWDHVSERESDRIADASRFKPPQYECAVHVEADSSSRSECMTVTPDGQFIIVGTLTGLSAICADSQQIADTWHDENLHITAVHTSTLASGKHLITTTDDLGQAGLFALAGNQLYHLCNVNEGTTENKVITTKCEASSAADYLTIFMQKPSSQEGWLEVYKLPKDSWIKDLDALVAKSGTKDTTQENVPEATVPVEGGELTVQAESTEEQHTQIQSASTQRGGERPSHKFNAINIYCKILPPPQLTGASHTSVQQGCKTVDSSCDVIGSGSHHMITSAHLEQRHLVFAQEHEHLMKYLPKDSVKPLVEPSFHYIQPGRILSQGLDNTTGQPSSLAVWWSEGTQLVLYSLYKQAKELERKADVVFPLSTAIKASCVSSDGSKVALALDNNNLVIWDMYLGTSKGVQHLDDDGHVTKVTFLDPSVCPQENTEYPPYLQTTSFYVMVAMDNGNLYLVKCGMIEEPPVLVNLSVAGKHDIPVVCCPVDGLPSLLLTSRENGHMYLQDLHRGTQLCEIVLPAEYDLATPWQPLIAVGNKGRMLYIQGQMKNPVESSPDDDDEGLGRQVAPPETGLFVFQLRSFPTLDKYRDCERPVIPFVVHNTVMERTDALLKERISQQAARTSRMQDRWSKFKSEISSIKQMQNCDDKKIQRKAFD